MTTQRWDIDPSHSGIHFAVRHMVISRVRGSFERFAGSLEFDEETRLASNISVSIETASVTTRDDKRDENLRSPEFFDAAAYPAITFASSGVEKIKGDKFQLLGLLTIHGVTQPVALDTAYLGRSKTPGGHERLNFEASTSLNRKAFGLRWSPTVEAGGFLVGDQIEISIEVQAVKA